MDTAQTVTVDFFEARSEVESSVIGAHRGRD
jgi:hypothetical protein